MECRVSNIEDYTYSDSSIGYKIDNLEGAIDNVESVMDEIMEKTSDIYDEIRYQCRQQQVTSAVELTIDSLKYS